MRANINGFTLLEVLLAAFILFLVLVTTTDIYRGALLSSSKAQNSLILSAAIPPIRILVTDVMQNNYGNSITEGTGQYGDLEYSWEASQAYVGEPSIVIQEDAGTSVKYFLWNVRLTLQLADLKRVYYFRELTW